MSVLLKEIEQMFTTIYYELLITKYITNSHVLNK